MGQEKGEVDELTSSDGLQCGALQGLTEGRGGDGVGPRQSWTDLRWREEFTLLLPS